MRMASKKIYKNIGGRLVLLTSVYHDLYSVSGSITTEFLLMSLLFKVPKRTLDLVCFLPK